MELAVRAQIHAVHPLRITQLAVNLPRALAANHM